MLSALDDVNILAEWIIKLEKLISSEKKHQLNVYVIVATDIVLNWPFSEVCARGGTTARRSVESHFIEFRESILGKRKPLPNQPVICRRNMLRLTRNIELYAVVEICKRNYTNIRWPLTVFTCIIYVRLHVNAYLRWVVGSLLAVITFLVLLNLAFMWSRYLAADLMTKLSSFGSTTLIYSKWISIRLRRALRMRWPFHFKGGCLFSNSAFDFSFISADLLSSGYHNHNN